MKNFPSLQKYAGKTRVILYAHGGWSVGAALNQDGSFQVDRGNKDADWYLTVAPSLVDHLYGVLQAHTELDAGEYSRDDHLLLMLYELFGENDENPWDSIKAFLRKNSVNCTQIFWPSYGF